MRITELQHSINKHRLKMIKIIQTKKKFYLLFILLFKKTIKIELITTRNF